jgi:hypothetical protein
VAKFRNMCFFFLFTCYSRFRISVSLTVAQHARQRLMRLTEKIENLKRRAANSVLAGKEEEAVDLLVQKKQLLEALERLKARIEVLDKLSTKINEA